MKTSNMWLCGLDPFMKILIVLILSCFVAIGGDADIYITTIVKTNDSGSLATKCIFTRDGQTNLVRNTVTRSGVIQIQIHRFYYRGLLVADFIAKPDSSGLTTKAGCPYSVGLELGRTNDVKSLAIGTADGVVFDVFMATNGLFYPVDSAFIQRANEIGSNVTRLLSPAHVTNTTPGAFSKDVQELIKGAK